MRYGIGIRNNLFFMSFVIGATCYSTYTPSVAAVELSEGQELAEEQRKFTIEAHQVPTELRPIRSMQLEMAEKADIHLKIIEKEGMSATAIVGVPSELRDFPVYGEKDLEIALEALSPYYGFTGTESLKVKASMDEGKLTAYDVEQYINGYPTGRDLRIWVNEELSKIVLIDGYVSIDRGLPKRSQIKREDAIDLVRTAIQEDRIKDSHLAHDRAELDLKGEVKTTLLYRETKDSRALSLWWGVGIPLKDPSKYPYEGGYITHQWYRIPPSGEVELWMDGGTAALTRTVCDGLANASTDPYCSSYPNPIVINAAGQCQPNYNCSGPNNVYRTPYDLAADVDVMFGDLVTGGHNVGDNNNGYGGDVEINIGEPNTGVGGEYTAVILGNGTTRAAMVLDPAFATSKKSSCS